ncbi:MAG TPA: hypothetical protein VN376_07130 [Longilinea sp.]|nr:hypothetical protein [Longilinea sp.]
MRDRPMQWPLLTGLVFGILIGLLISWVLVPPRYYDTNPSMLSNSAQAQYRQLVALAYQAGGNLGRASARLELLADPNIISVLADQAVQAQSQDGNSQEAAALSALASGLYQQAMQIGETPTQQSGQTVTPQVAVDTNSTRQALTPLATFTPRPQATLAPTQGSPFALRQQEQVCDPDLIPGLLQVEIQDASGRSVPGIHLTITWPGGQDSFTTGLFPEIDDGYADFTMTPGTVYSLRAGDAGEVIEGLFIPECTNADGSAYYGGMRVVLGQ